MRTTDQPNAETEIAPPPRPLVSARLGVVLVFLAGLVVLAHGCHGDEDNELWNLLRVSRTAVPGGAVRGGD